VNDVESAAEISTVTRWQIGGSGGADDDIPPRPFFGLAAVPKGGGVVLSGVSFSDLENTHTVTSATLTLHYWDELQGTPALELASAISDTDVVLDLSEEGTAVVGGLIQIGTEVLRVDAMLLDGTRYEVTRDIDDSGAVSHAAGSTVYTLERKTAIAPFPPEFFGSPYSGSWTYTVSLPDARVAAAELLVTNDRGNSASRGIYLTHNEDVGLRTLAGGQYSIQVSGYLAVDEQAAPPLVTEASYAVRDVYAVLGRVADAEIQVRVDVDGESYCTLTFEAGLNVSDAVDGNSLEPLIAGSKVTLAVLSVGATFPGADLTVLIRL